MDDVSKLPNFVLEETTAQHAVDFITGGNLLAATPADLDNLIAKLAPHMRHKRAEVNPIMVFDLHDFIASRGYVIIQREGRQEEVYVTDYRTQVEQRITDLVRTQPAIQAILHGEPVTDEQLITLERTLRQELATDPVDLTDEHLRQAYGSDAKSLLGLVRTILDLDPAMMPDYAVVVERQFERYLQQHQTMYSANQLRFPRAVKAVLVRHVKPVAKPGWRLDRNTLYDDDAFAAFGAEAVGHLFTDQQIADVLTFADSLTA